MDRRASSNQETRQRDLRTLSGPDPHPRHGEKTQEKQVVALGSAFVRTIRHFWPDLEKWLKALPDTRFEPFVVYAREFLFWWGLQLFLFKLGSRRQLDFDLRCEQTQVLDNVNRMAGAQQDSLPVHNTLRHFMGHLGAPAVANVRTLMIRRLIRMKALAHSRLLGRYYVVAADGTGWLVFGQPHCPNCLEQTHGEKSIYMHMVLEAKLVTPSGLALSMATEFIENADWPDSTSKSEEARKQDCELKALGRLLPGFRRDFPQILICLTNDSLYGCGTAIQLAKDYRCSYIFVFKPGRTPALWEEFKALQKLSTENTLRVQLPNGPRQVFRWVNDIEYIDDQKRTHVLNAIECIETKPNGKVTTFAWITDLPVSAKTVREIADRGGRARSKIENQGFNIQKNSDLNLEHAYSTQLEIMKAFYYLLQIAHIMLQFLEQGSLLRRLAQGYGKTPLQLFGSLKNIARRLLECFRNDRIPDEAYDLLAAARIQIRLDSS